MNIYKLLKLKVSTFEGELNKLASNKWILKARSLILGSSPAMYDTLIYKEQYEINTTTKVEYDQSDGTLIAVYDPAEVNLVDAYLDDTNGEVVIIEEKLNS